MKKTLKVIVHVSTNRVGSEVSDEIEVEVDDNATPDEIEDAVEFEAKEWMWNNVEFGFAVIENNPNP